MVKKTRGKRVRGVLGTIFASVAGIGALGGAGYVGVRIYTENNNTPKTIYAFGQKAGGEPRFRDPTGGQWNDMMGRQQSYMNNAKDARQYQSFLAEFNQFKGESLTQMADNVNAAVLDDITYNEATYGNQTSTYWASPYETETYREGDCKDFATLQYAIMRHLGVPTDRLFVANVNAEDSTAEIDHTILLVNTAPTVQKQNFIVMNDGGPVVNANDYEHYNTLPDGWDQPYVFFDARNQNGFWASRYSNSSAGNGPITTTAKTAAVSPGLKMKIG